jgi:hypothetical protein
MGGVLLVGRDVGAAAPLAMVSVELAKLGIGCMAFLRECPGPSFVNGNDVGFVLTGMSSSPELSRDELGVLRMAISAEVPFGVFADIFGAWKGRKWFEEYRQKASVIFVLNQEEVAEARVMYPNAQVFGFGNPRWEEFFTQRMTREQVRAKLSLSGSDIVVEVPGGKDLECNLLHFGAVIDAARRLREDDRSNSYVVIISIHPGDDPKGENNHRGEYEKLAGRFDWVRITDKSLISADNMLAGVDMVVQSASTVGVTASCQRIPVINYFSEPALDRLEGSIGSREWPPVTKGMELAVTNDFDKLCAAMQACHFGLPSCDFMTKCQEEVYPKPVGKPAAALIAEAIRDIIGKK